MKEIILYHTKEEVGKTRALYEHAFPEDHRDFVSYYYEHKCSDNASYVVAEDGNIISMMHLNPFLIQWKCGEEWKSLQTYYIVAVATNQAFRRQGYMDLLMRQMMLEYMQNNVPYVVLLPVNPAIYEPYGFVTVGIPLCRIPKEGVVQETQQIKPEEFSKLASFSNDLLKSRYDHYVERTEAYYERLEKELTCQHGGIYWIKENDRVIGYCSYESLEGTIQELECLTEYTIDDFSIEVKEQNHQQYGLMARILSLEAMAPYICLKKNAIEQGIVIILVVDDHFQASKKTIYSWRISKEKSELICLEQLPENHTNILKCSIEQMTQFLFGTKRVTDIFPLINQKLLEDLEQVCVRENISFKEVV